MRAERLHIEEIPDTWMVYIAEVMGVIEENLPEEALLGTGQITLPLESEQHLH